MVFAVDSSLVEEVVVEVVATAKEGVAEEEVYMVFYKTVALNEVLAVERADDVYNTCDWNIFFICSINTPEGLQKKPAIKPMFYW